MSFVHLHVHTEYSLLDGYSRIPKLMERAKELGMPALGITDHGTMFGVIDFFNEAKKHDIKPIIGLEGYMAARKMTDKDSQQDRSSTHLLLLAQNQTGYQNLMKIASAAQLEGFYYFPRIDHDFLAAHSEGLIATSGCMSAEIPRAIQNGQIDLARQKMDWYYEVFGRDNFFLELQDHDIPELHTLNKSLVEMGERYQANFVATNDVHYVDQADAKMQDVLLCVQTSSLLSDPKRMRMTDESYYLRPIEEMSTIFKEVPGAIENTLLIAERCEVDLSPKGYHLPEFPVPEGYTAESYLRELCEQGLEQRYGSSANDPEIRERLEYELSVIHEMGFDAYFLIVWDLCQYAQRENIWYNARGSAAGSIVAYSLEITLIDPIEHGLIFERFLNPARINMPDIDLDFQDDLRTQMMEYCAQRYGEDKVAAIITFGTLKARAAVRDVGRVLDIPLNDVDRVAKMIPAIPGKPVTIDQTLEENKDFKREYESKSYVKELIDTARELEGTVRNAGTHAAGVVVTDKPVVEYVPLHRPTGAAEDAPIKTVTQFEMKTVDDLGLLKVDFLGLSSLTIMQRACNMIKARHGIDLDLNTIPIDDPATYDLLGRGDTAGVFQFEGSGMRRWMMEMKPTQLDHAVAMVALFRPGPMDFIPTYIRRMHGEEETEYRHESLAPIFEDTYGIAVYQEQLMRAVIDIAGYEPSDADDLRKAIGKKIAEKIAKHRKKFVKGASENGMPEQTAEDIFTDWENFARYGFNKAHAADYGLIAVQTAYLKAHYTVEYMAALISVYKGDSDKVAFYIGDCRRMGIEVLPPDVNHSGWDFTIEDDEDGSSSIRFGLGAVKNVGHGPVDEILAGREGKPFTDLIDFAKRVDLRHVGKRALECMIKVGALDGFGERVPLLEAMDQIHSISSSHFLAEEQGQLTFFGSDSGVTEQVELREVPEGFNKREELNWERELVGLYVSDHPLSEIMPQLEAFVSHTTGQLSLAEDRELVRVAGLVNRIRYHTTKKGDEMAFVGLEDTEGIVDIVIFPRTWAESRDIVQYDKVIFISGKVDAQNGEPKILADKISTEATVVTSHNPTPPKPAANGNGAKATQKAKPVTQPPPVEPESVEQYKEEIAEVESQRQIAEEPEDYWLDEDMPPPPEEPPYPDDWYPAEPEIDLSKQPALMPQNGQAATEEPMPVAASAEAVEEKVEAAVIESVPPVSSVVEAPVIEAPKDSGLDPAVGLSIEVDKPDEESGGQYIVSPDEADDDGPAPQMLRMVLRSSGDKARDILRIRRIHGMLISYPGKDRFAFYVIEGSKGYLMEFPNDTTGICDELMGRMTSLLGAENLRVEAITYQ